MFGRALRADLLGQEPSLEQSLQHPGDVPSVEPGSCEAIQASLAHILSGKHDAQQPVGVTRQRRARVGAVVGLDGSDDVIQAEQVDGHGWGVPWLGQGRTGRSRARASPRQEIGSCETGLSWGMLCLQRRQRFPGSGRMFMAHPHRWALACLGSGSGSSFVSAAELAPRQPVRLADRLASLQAPSEPRARRRALRLPIVVPL